MKKTVKVLHVISKLNPGGIETLLTNIHQKTDKRRVQFDFLINSSEKGYYDDTLKQNGANLFYLNRLSPKYFFLNYAKDLNSFFKTHQGQYQIVHSHIDTLSAIPLQQAKKCGIPIRIAHSHNSSITDTGIKKAIKLFYKKQITHYATDLFACSKLAAQFCFGTSNFNLLPNGIDIERFTFKSEKRTEYRKKLNLNDDEILVLNCAAFRKQKNHLFLLEVFSELKKLLKNAKLLLIGEGEEEQAIKSKVKNLELSKDVIFAGSVSDVENYLFASDVFLFPSLFEGLGIALVEAQVSGLGVFTSDVIPEEANLMQNYFAIPLSKPSYYWAEKIYHYLAQTKNTERSVPNLASRFDLNKTVKMLENFYIEKYNSLLTKA